MGHKTWVDNLKIKAIEPIAVSLPMKKPVQMAGETVARADKISVRIEAEDGTVGWGEAASAPTMTGETAVTAYQLIHVTPSGAPISELPLALVPTVGVPLLLAVHITSVTALARPRRTPQPATAPLTAAAK